MSCRVDRLPLAVFPAERLLLSALSAKRLLLAAALIALVAASAAAAPIQWRVEDGGNGHFYNVIGVTRGITWPDAQTATAARGSGWYLATITSPEENAFVYGLLAAKPQFWTVDEGGDALGPWLGAVKKGAAFGWGTGEAFAYANWAPGQPSGIGDRITLFGDGAPDGPLWRNVGGQSTAVAYVIETQASEGLVAVIEEPNCQGAAGVSNIRGYAFSTINGITIDRVIEVTFDRNTPQDRETDVACCSSRQDVKSVFPVAPVRSGFAGIYNWCLLPPGKHTITLRVESSTGRLVDVTREFVSHCEHPEVPFVQAGAFDWASATGSCASGADGVVVCRPDPEICDGELRYEWSQASQGLALRSGCIADGANPPPPPACSDEVVTELVVPDEDDD